MTIPKIAFILLWFPKPSETFIFREIADLWNMRIPIKVFTLYGRLKKGLSREMADFSNHPERLGLSSLPGIGNAVIYFFRHHPMLTRNVLRRALLLPWRGAEKTGENFWAILCAFRLARRFQQENICHIHAPWASGPATAAWIAHGLTGIPFSFSARAWDIRPPDGALQAKARDAGFIRCESKYNIDYMARFLGGDSGKISAIYNPITLKDVQKSPVRMKPPVALLAVGRLVEKKGYPHLLRACRILKQSGMQFHLKNRGHRRNAAAAPEPHSIPSPRRSGFTSGTCAP